MTFWAAISVAYLLLSVVAATTWWKLRTVHKQLENPTYLTTDGIAIGGNPDGPEVNVEKMFSRIATANMIALILSGIGAILTYLQL